MYCTASIQESIQNENQLVPMNQSINNSQIHLRNGSIFNETYGSQGYSDEAKYSEQAIQDIT